MSFLFEYRWDASWKIVLYLREKRVATREFFLFSLSCGKKENRPRHVRGGKSKRRRRKKEERKKFVSATASSSSSSKDEDGKEKFGGRFLLFLLLPRPPPRPAALAVGIRGGR